MPLLATLLDNTPQATPLRLVTAENHTPSAFATASGFTPAAGKIAVIPTSDGQGIAEVLVGAGDGTDRWLLAALPHSLPAGDYVLQGTHEQLTDGAFAWLMGGYGFDRYKEVKAPMARLVWPSGVARAAIEQAAHATALARDLINIPAEHMGPAELHAAAQHLADAHGATLTAVVGDDLLAQNYPLIHAVGRASPRAPRLLEMVWGDAAHPAVTIVGKGVCFDSGGLNLKEAGGMRLMKKDMGGAAHTLGLAQMMMAAGLPVRLRVLIPAVDNVVAGNAMRPGDVFRSRAGLSVEISNTDAEGRLVLADALAEASAHKPVLIIDFATLTGAARVALGPQLPALFCNDEAWASDLAAASQRVGDPLWRLPLWPGYAGLIASPLADLDNAPEGGMAGAITAALFLERFVSRGIAWAHFDTYAWNNKARPGRPIGGDALGMRAVYAALEQRFT